MRAPAEHSPDSPRSRRLRLASTVLALALTAAVLGLAAFIWTGGGGAYRSFAQAERLPWPHEQLAPMPGVASSIDVASQHTEPYRSTAGGRWSDADWSVLLVCLLTCGAATYLLERKRQQRVEPLALLAACLALAMGFRLMLACDSYILDSEDVMSPPFTWWRRVQPGVGGAVVLQVATAIVASLAMVRIARDRARRGLTLALYSLSLSAYTFCMVTYAFVAPYHLEPPFAVTDLQLPRTVHATFRGPGVHEPKFRVVIRADGRSTIRLAFVDDTNPIAPFEFMGHWNDEALLAALENAVEQIPEGYWFMSDTRGRVLDVGVLLECDESVPFEYVRPVLERLDTLRAPMIRLVSAPPVASMRSFSMLTWLTLGHDEEPAVQLLAAERRDTPAVMVFGGVHYEHAGAAVAANKALFEGDARFRLRVEDDVLWRDVVHALDALWGTTGLDP